MSVLFHVIDSGLLNVIHAHLFAKCLWLGKCHCPLGLGVVEHVSL